MIEKKPIVRSKVRAYLGKQYYTYKRYVKWIFNRKKFSKDRSEKKLEYKIFSHKTPVLRKLKDVDMQLQYNKITNLKLAIDKIDGIIIKPGETFSYWRLIGKPTYRKGYVDGLILNPDGSFKAGEAGGLCQLSNMIYWITLHTPLKVVERYRHSHDIFPDTNRTQPFGSGATCVYNYLDLQIHNDSEVDYQLNLTINDEFLYGEWRSNEEGRYKYEIYEKEHFLTTGWWGGYIRNNVINRRVFNMFGEEIDDEFVTENHAIMMYEPFLKESSRVVEEVAVGQATDLKN
ncbi:VanW family protein [Oceanirhabdus sp. W0125-5]|uniref:VanW family protein n=1 Tax=Oceanirhabdus sp. W0125-5 TaxID=2999116 RepID=UPI0022F2FB47|nr:VanW family protein [Oceanirhabdus sp. W0125-5]WBW96768.1 VanW family protein [Oceanirhabdus sp. W0125-5]